MRQSLNEARGLHVGQHVKVLVPTLGDDENDVERSLPAGAKGVIVRIEDLGAPQRMAFHVTVEDAITQVFDEADDPIIVQLEPVLPLKFFAAPAPFTWEYAGDARFLYLYLNGVQMGCVIGEDGKYHWDFYRRSGDVSKTHGHVGTIEDAVASVERFAATWMVEVVAQIEAALDKKKGGEA